MSEQSQHAIKHAIKVGTIFDTDFESGCIVTTEPESHGSFNALDSDGVECGFNVNMIERVWPPLAEVLAKD